MAPEVRHVPTAELVLHPDSRPLLNSRVVKIMNDQTMLHDPLLVDDADRVVDGGHRLEARKRLGYRYTGIVRAPANFDENVLKTDPPKTLDDVLKT